MAEYLTTNEVQATLDRIIKEAEKELILISPYIKLNSQTLGRLKVVAEKGVRITIIYRDKINEEEHNKLRTINNISLKCINDLHAKCYFNEKEMIITSFNLLQSSEKNWEMGIRIDRALDSKAYDDARYDAKAISKNSLSVQIEETKKIITIEETKVYKTNKIKSQSKGYCIRCETPIAYNVDKPYCADCYASWDKYKNRDYEENVCHHCGNDEETSMNKPQCKKCYNLWKKEEVA